MGRLLVLLISLGLSLPLVVTAPPASSDHEQDRGAQFDHRGGNEWWVEVQITGVDHRFWTPYVRDEGGDWLPMEHPSWAPDDGTFVKSFHIEPGHDVRFKLTSRGNAILSCWFTHPAGQERCDGTETFTAEFENVRGNSWWVETDLEASQPVEEVRASIHRTGWWHQLSPTDWGSWATSFYVPDGELIEFTARSQTTGAHDLSACYEWPQAREVACPPPAFWAAFNQAQGDQDRVEVTAHHAHGELDQVEARVDWGPWQPLDHLRTSEAGPERWGGDVHAPDGSFVEFRARSADGQVACQDNAFAWVPPAGVDADRVPAHPDKLVWANWRGNAWWVQVSTVSDRPLVTVQASVDGGPWQNLEQQRWCDWAASIHVEDGSWVSFRAVLPDSSTWGGGTVQWPPAGDEAPRFR